MRSRGGETKNKGEPQKTSAAVFLLGLLHFKGRTWRIYRGESLKHSRDVLKSMRQSGQTEACSRSGGESPPRGRQKYQIWNEDTWWRRAAFHYPHLRLLTLPKNTLYPLFFSGYSFPLYILLWIAFASYAMLLKAPFSQASLVWRTRPTSQSVSYLGWLTLRAEKNQRGWRWSVKEIVHRPP